jgi:hypothetical protein
VPEPRGIAQIECEIRIGRVRGDRLPEKLCRRGIRRSRRAAQLRDTEVVEKSGVGLLSIQDDQRVDRFRVPAKAHRRERRVKTRLARQRVIGRYLADDIERLLVLALLGVDAP